MAATIAGAHPANVNGDGRIGRAKPSDLTVLIVLIVLWAVATAYNLFKPFHIDDTAYLEIARWIASHPLHPLSGEVNWAGVAEPIYKLNQPPLYFYLMAGWGVLFGYSEPAMHALQSLPALACIVLFYRLAAACCQALALWMTALLALGPAFIVEQNMMVDVPLLALWLAFFNLLIIGRSSGKQTQRYVLAALACSAAVLIKYSSLLLVVILFISLVIERRRAQAWTIAIPMIVIAAWSLFNLFDYGGVHIGTRNVAHQPRQWATEGLAWLLVLGGLTPLGFIYAAKRCFSGKGASAFYIATGFAFIALVFAVAADMITDRQSDLLLWWACAANGTLIGIALAHDFWDVAFAGWRKGGAGAAIEPRFYLLLWAVGTTAFYAMFAPFIASRHVLLILPPVTLLLGMHWGSSLGRQARYFAISLTFVVSLGLCVSDWRFAGFYADEAAALKAWLPPAGAKWASGHWGRLIHIETVNSKKTEEKGRCYFFQKIRFQIY